MRIVSGIWLMLPSLITTLMLGGFLTAMIRAYALGLEINCGCFGPGEKVGPLSFVRDGSFFALSLARHHRRNFRSRAARATIVLRLHRTIRAGSLKPLHPCTNPVQSNAPLH